MGKPLKFNDYKKIRKKTYNQMNDWVKAFYNRAYQNGVDDAAKHGVAEIKPSQDVVEKVIEKIVVPDDCTVAIEQQDLIDLLVSVKGVGQKRAIQIVEKLEKYGVNKSLWE